jgi:uncharacterized membrane protein YcgQ (UPF0703/DUF1980 family)
LESAGKKKKILEEIIMKEEDVLSNLKTLVQLSRSFLKVEETTGRVVLTEKYSFTNSEKVFLILVGKYFAKHYEILESEVVSNKEVSEDLGVPVTTLSGPLGELVEKHTVEKCDRGQYKVNPHKVEATLQKLKQKHISEKSK